MKLLKLTFIALLISLTTAVKAQDATNDAIWEETISFLMEYLPNFDHLEVTIYAKCNSGDYTTVKHYIKDNTFFKETEDGKNIHALDLSLLKNVKMYKDGPDTSIEATGTFIKGTFG